MQKYYIIYPRGDTSRLTIALIPDWEVGEYSIASRHSFAYEELEKAFTYAKELSRLHGIPLDISNLDHYDRQQLDLYLD